MTVMHRREALKNLTLAVLAAKIPLPESGRSGNACLVPDNAGLLRRQAQGWNIVITLIDAATAKHMSAFGYQRKTTPNIDTLAEDSLVFERAFAPAPYTLSSMGSFFSGLYPHHHGVTHLGPKLSEAVPTLGEVLRGTSLRSMAFSGNRLGGSLGGFARGFEKFVEFQTLSELKDWDERQEMILGWLEDDRRPGRFLLYVHYVPPHEAYLPPPPFQGKFGGPYNGSVIPNTRTLLAIDRGDLAISERDRRHIIDCYDEHMLYADHLVGQLIGRLQTLGLWERTLFVLLSDHGEAFGEHGRMLHNTTAYEEMVWVPFIMRFPAGVIKPQRLPSLICSSTDLLPTVADLLGAQVPQGIDGRSLLPVIAGERREVRDEVLLRTIGNRPCWGLRTARFKYLYDSATGRSELYDLQQDRSERINIINDRETLAERLHGRLRELVGPSLDSSP